MLHFERIFYFYNVVYYICLMENKRERGYRLKWVKHHGSIPVDSNGRSYEIHHIDGNRKNNDISNLTCIPIEEHLRIHEELEDWGSVSLIRMRMGLPPLPSWNHSETSKNKVRESNIGKIWINNGKVIKWIKKGSNIPEGWKKGMVLVKRVWINDGKSNKQWNKSNPIPKGWKLGLLSGRIWINNIKEVKRIKEYKINEYLEKGWKIGIEDFIWINNGIKNKRIHSTLLKEYIHLGFVKGKLPYKNKSYGKL